MRPDVEGSDKSGVILLNLLKKDKILLLISFLLISAISWWYLFYLAQNMDCEMMDMMPQTQKWNIEQFLPTFLMWFVMMAGMMIPSVTPAVFIYTSVYEKRVKRGKPFVSAWIFLLGYLTVWLGFSFIATSVQWILHDNAMLTPMMETRSSMLGGSILIASGIYQWSSFKYSCLKHCRSPIHFLMEEWRETGYGSFIMGLRHGYYCVGCCWLLMLILFFTGIMNLLWMALIAVFVLVEKVSPSSFHISRVSGLVMLLAGLYILISK